MKKYFFIAYCLLLSLVVNGQTSGVGILTESPTESLDVNGTVRIRDLPISNSTSDIAIVADSAGVLKFKLSETKGVMRAYLDEDFTSGTTPGEISKIKGFRIIDNPNGDFNTSNNVFTPPVKGLYRVSISVALLNKDSGSNVLNWVLGLVTLNKEKKDEWVIRFSIPKAYATLTGDAGNSVTFIGVVQLEAGKEYWLGCSSYAKLFARPTGNTGTGIGSYFDIVLLKNN